MMTDAEDYLPIIQGIRMSPGGEVILDPKLEEPLCDLAISLQGPDDLPVDVEHVVAAIIIASRKGQISDTYTLNPRDRTLKALLKPHIKMIFQRYGGEITEEDEGEEMSEADLMRENGRREGTVEEE